MKVEELQNTKIYLKTETEVKQFQEKIFKLGIKWSSGETRVIVYQSHPFFYIYNRVMSCNPATNYNFFKESKNKQIFLEDVLSIKEPSTLATGDPVLVRDYDAEDWEYDVLGRIRSDGWKYKCIGNDFAQCIPYEGNEHLLGTSVSFSY